MSQAMGTRATESLAVKARDAVSWDLLFEWAFIVLFLVGALALIMAIKQGRL